VREWNGYKWHRLWTSCGLLCIHELTSLFLTFKGTFVLPKPFAMSQERICSMDLVTYNDGRYTAGGRAHIASDMCMEVGYLCYLVCSVAVFFFVTLLEHVPVLLQVLADHILRKFLCSYKFIKGRGACLF
jgi:hypothetical protein